MCSSKWVTLCRYAEVADAAPVGIAMPRACSAGEDDCVAAIEQVHLVVGLYKLSSVVTHSLRVPGFQPLEPEIGSIGLK
jgi:hypothetical protein